MLSFKRFDKVLIFFPIIFMTIVVPKDYHAKEMLEKYKISCITQDKAEREDIRRLRIGILNIMPQAEKYEFNLLYPLGRSILQVEPVFIRLRNHDYLSTEKNHLDNLYLPFLEAINDKYLDGLILTGAPVEKIPFEDVLYWKEIREILETAEKNIPSTLGICWGGLAIAKYLGIEKKVQPQKIFGVFEFENLNPYHLITGGMNDVFWCPYTSYAGVPGDVLEQKQREGLLNLLASSPETGYLIFETQNHKFMVHLGHPEYETNRLIEEYYRDKEKGKKISLPKNLNLDKPVNRWRGHCLEFFSQWIKFIHENTPY